MSLSFPVPMGEGVADKLPGIRAELGIEGELGGPGEVEVEVRGSLGPASLEDGLDLGPVSLGDGGVPRCAMQISKVKRGKNHHLTLNGGPDNIVDKMGTWWWVPGEHVSTPPLNTHGELMPRRAS